MTNILVCTSYYDNEKGLVYPDSRVIGDIGVKALKAEKAKLNSPRKIAVLDGGTPTRAHHDDGRGM